MLCMLLHLIELIRSFVCYDIVTIVVCVYIRAFAFVWHGGITCSPMWPRTFAFSSWPILVRGRRRRWVSVVWGWGSITLGWGQRRSWVGVAWGRCSIALGWGRRRRCINVAWWWESVTLDWQRWWPCADSYRCLWRGTTPGYSCRCLSWGRRFSGQCKGPPGRWGRLHAIIYGALGHWTLITDKHPLWHHH